MTSTQPVNDPWREPDALDHEVRGMQWAVDVARRNPWFGGDVLAPEFEPVLAAIVASRLRSAPASMGRPEPTNRWSEPSTP